MLIERILIIGFGSIGKRHLHIVRELMPNAKIKILRHEYTSVFPQDSDGCVFSLSEAISFSPDIAIIANPATFHLDYAIALAEIGVHLLVEKPLSTTIKDVSRLIDICKNRKLTLTVGYNLRFMPSIQYYRKLLMESYIGNILSVRCEVGQYLPSWRPGVDYRATVSANNALGGGVMLELSHEIDYLCWIFGDIDWVQCLLSRQSALEIDVEDSAHVALGFAPALDGSRLIGLLNLDFIRHDSMRQCIAIGESGSLMWNGLKGSVSLYRPNSQGWEEIFIESDKKDYGYKAELKNFIDCVSNDKKPLISGTDGLRVLQIVEAARQSNASGGSKYKLKDLQ